MRAAWIIALNTYRQTVRQRVFVNVLLFGLGMVAVSVVIGNITFGYPERVVRSIGLAGLQIALDLIALLISVGLVHSEIDRKTLFVVLTRPVERWQYVVGRYSGLLLTLIVTLVGLAAAFVCAISYVQGTLNRGDLVAIVGSLGEASVLSAVGILLSCFSTPTLSTGLGIGVWIVGASSDDLIGLTTGSDPFTKLIAKGVYYGFPALSRFNFREEAIYRLPVGLGDLAFAGLYSASYSLFLIALASVVLSRREMV